MTSPQLTQVTVLDDTLPYEPVRDPAVVRQHLTRTLAKLAAKRRRIDLLWAYHDGEQPQIWMTEKVREALGKQFDSNLAENYCELAIEAPLSRLQVTDWTGDDDQNVSRATDEFADNDLDLDQEELYRHAMIAGEAFVIVWPRTDDDGTAVIGEDGLPDYDISFNDPRQVHVEFGTVRRRDRAWGCKVFLDGARWRANLYYPPTPDLPGELIRMVTVADAKVDKGVATWPAVKDFVLDVDDPGGPHDLPGCPVVRFARDRRGRSRLLSLIPIQDKVNKLSAGKMVAAEFAAFRQRYALTDQDLPDGFFRATAGNVWKLSPVGTEDGGPGAPAIPAKVGEFDITPLANYDASIDREVDAFFTISALPRHMRINQGRSPSGDAVKADEGPFVAVIRDYQQMFGGSWADVWQLLGVQVTPVWADPEVHNELTTAQELKTLTDAGVPLRWAMQRVYGLDGPDLDLVMADVQAAQAAATSAGALALRAFDQGRPAVDLTA